MYSGTFTGKNGFNKSNENAAIYIRDINGKGVYARILIRKIMK